MKLITVKSTMLILGLFIVFGIFTRFYDLNWGAPFYFHPDERNIASAISQLQFPSQMNPHFFAYGSLPIYIIYFSVLIFNFLTICHLTFSNCPVTFDQALIGSRILSAGLSVLLIPLMFIIGRKLKNQKAGLLLAFLTATSVGLIQYSHFGTYEITMTFFTTLLFLVSLNLLHQSGKWNLIFAGIIVGILVSCKVTNLILLPVPAFILSYQRFKHRVNQHILRLVFNLLTSLLFYAAIIVYIFCLTNPYTFWDYSSFISSMKYESSVALGTMPVFYTGDFFGTLPVFYQIQHILPFLITPFLLLFLAPAFGYIIVRSLFKPRDGRYGLLAVFLLITFLPQSLLFVKWTRYMVPVIPFLYSFIALFIIDGIGYLHLTLPQKRYRQLIKIVLVAGGIISIIYAISFIITVYVEPDTRLAAAHFAQRNIPSGAPILSEVYDLGITAFNPYFSNIVLFNFYDLDNNSPITTSATLQQAMNTSDYIILPSQRILKARIQHAKKFPIGNSFYKDLLTNKSGFKKMYETSCDIWCYITYSGNPVNSYEETANVFDRPTVYIFEKNK